MSSRDTIHPDLGLLQREEAEVAMLQFENLQLCESPWVFPDLTRETSELNLAKAPVRW